MELTCGRLVKWRNQWIAALILEEKYRKIKLMPYGSKLGGLRLSQVPIISLDSVRQPFCDIFWVGDGRYLAASFTMRTWRGGRTSIWFSAWVGFDHWPCQPKHQFGEHAQCQGLNEARPLLETLSVPKFFFLSGSLLWHVLELLGIS